MVCFIITLFLAGISSLASPLCAQTYSVKGHVYDINGSSKAGVTMALSGTNSAEYTTDAQGYYEFFYLYPGGSYQVTPSYLSYLFSPSSRSYTDPSADLQNQNFVCFATNTYTYAGVSFVKDTVDIPGDTGLYTSLVLDSTGNPHISYHEDTFDTLKYAHWTGTVWSTQTVDSSASVGKYTSLALDSNDYAHISYYNSSTKDLKYARWTGAAWNIETVDSAGEVGAYTSLELDSNGYAHISYYDSTNGSLRYAKWTGTSWSTQTVDSGGEAGQRTSLALDSNGYAHISYYDKSNVLLKYARWTGTAWSTQTVNPSGNAGEYNSIALDSNDMPHIAYRDNTSSDLSYARKTNAANIPWILYTIDSGGDVGTHTSIVIDSNNNPHISYMTATGLLKYAGYTGVSWSTCTVDTLSVLSGYTSIALDFYNRPRVSYYDYSSGNLCFARLKNNPTLSWTGEERYESDGLNFEEGYDTTSFVFRITYTDENNEGPGSGYPAVHILNNGSSISGSPFAMSEADSQDSTYTDGKIYEYSTTLSASSNYTYYFEAYDIHGMPALGDPLTAVDAPDVSGLNIPAAGDLKIVGSTERRGVINPDKGDTAQIYFQGTELGDYTCRIFSADGELLYESTKYDVNTGTFEWAPAAIATGIYIVHVEGPGIKLKRKLAIVR